MKQKIILVIIIILLSICGKPGFAVKKPVKAVHPHQTANTKKPGKLHKSHPIIRSKKPVKPKSLIEQVKFYINSNQTQKALDLLNKAVLKDHYNPEIFAISADLFYKNSQYEEAELLARKALSLNSKDNKSYLILGDVLLKNYNTSTSRLYNELPPTERELNMLSESLRCFNAASESDPTSALPHIGMAKIYYIQDNQLKVNDELLKAKELVGENPDNLFKLGETLLYCEDYEKAIKYLKKAISARSKNSPKAHVLLAGIYEKLGSYEDAQKEYIASVKTNKKFPVLKGSILQASNTSAVKPVNEILHADDLLIMDRFTEARESYLKILQQDQLNTDAVSNLAEMYYTLWIFGNFDTRNYFTDSTYFDNLPPNKLKIPLIKFRLVAEPEMTDTLEDGFNKIANNKSENLSDKFDSARALFILGNYIGAKLKLQEITTTDLTDYNKLKMAKALYFDQNYIEADNLLKTIKLPEYENYVKTMQDRIQVRKKQAEEIFNRGMEFYKNKKYDIAVVNFENEIKTFPTDKQAHLYYAYALQKQGKTDKAVNELNLYMNLELMYPSVKPELTPNDIQKLIKTWQIPVKK